MQLYDHASVLNIRKYHFSESKFVTQHFRTLMV